ncbi:hypothetical protein SDC9_138559 [bioreactor metagenome]|uniref:Uncharacterized protein n=1 Tax=bioreactor metagenome TaxID=1076179 RepID=A0A645DPL2_9ZZZZ
MTQVGASEIFAGIAIATFFDWPKVGFIGPAFDADGAFAGKGSPVAGHTGRQNAVEHIHPASDQFDQLCRGAKPHRVAGLVCGQEWLGDLHCLKHLRLGFAHAHTADGIAVEIESDQGLGAFLAHGRVDATLHNAEHLLPFGPRLLPAFTRPADGTLNSGTQFAWCAGMCRAIVKNHGDIGTELTLDAHGFFRP